MASTPVQNTQSLVMVTVVLKSYPFTVYNLELENDGTIYRLK
jgi:hypothetical protein